MKKSQKLFGLQSTDEMEMQISYKAQSYARIFTLSALLIWVIWDVVLAAASYDYEGNILPWLIFLGNLLVEDSSKKIMKYRATSDDADYVAEQNAKRPKQAIGGILSVVLVVVLAVILSGVFRYLFFEAGILK